jgi:acetylglutamate kinase
METLLVKLGGRAGTDLQTGEEVLAELAELTGAYRIVLVHGGGAEVTAMSRRLGMEPRFEDGVRMTSPGEMDVVDMVLAGKMNTLLVRRFSTLGVRAVGLSGADAAMFACSFVGDSEHNRTARIESADTGLIDQLLSAGYVPVVSSVAVGADGRGVNVNADEAALALARSLPAERLVFLSDTDGVLDAPPPAGAVISKLESSSLEALIGSGTIAGGMVPKVRSAAEAIARGVRQVVIGRFTGGGDLLKLLDGTMGTSIVYEEEP